MKVQISLTRFSERVQIEDVECISTEGKLVRIDTFDGKTRWYPQREIHCIWETE